jgi:hypothetical protein
MPLLHNIASIVGMAGQPFRIGPLRCQVHWPHASCAACVLAYISPFQSLAGTNSLAGFVVRVAQAVFKRQLSSNSLEW